MSFNEEFSNILKQAISHSINKLNTWLPGKIVKVVDPDLRKCDVVPTIKLKYLGKTYDYPIIRSVPVAMFGGKNNFFRNILEKDDPIIILFSQRNIDNWLYNGDDKEVKSNSSYNYNDAVGYPGLFNFKNIPSISSNDCELVYNDSSIVIKENGQVNINNGNLTVEP